MTHIENLENLENIKGKHITQKQLQKIVNEHNARKNARKMTLKELWEYIDNV